MSEAVTVPSLTMMNLIVSEKSLGRDRHTHTQDSGWSTLKFTKWLINKSEGSMQKSNADLTLIDTEELF